ncbi:MAG: hypothetical protein P8N09_03840 [Planctomycetota bacterium]|nr:hypothetical protein [Planctomycetota bacterium]
MSGSRRGDRGQRDHRCRGKSNCLMTMIMSFLTAAILCGAGHYAADADDPERRSALQKLLEDASARGAKVTPEVFSSGSREAFLEVLSSDLFLHEDVGPFDVFVMQADGFKNKATAEKTLAAAVRGLEPVVPVIKDFFGGSPGLVSGRRFPIVLASSETSRGEHSFDQLIALLDWAEEDYTNWKSSGNPVWGPESRAAETVRTWEAQLFNLAQKKAATHGADFLEHAVGYYTLAHIAARALRQGSWGLVPPWLAQGLIDELDIAAYGEAWVGGDTWTKQIAGWSRPGWSGFVPQGMSPPPPVTGPPANLAVTITSTGNSWQQRSTSGLRHWNDLAADRESEAPASFQFMAENESFLPRDRAYARCLMHMLLEIAPNGRAPLTEMLDRVPLTSLSGMPDAEPITVVMSRVLGGVPAVTELESLPLGRMLEVIGQPALGAQIKALGGEGMLDFTDHREQAAWLYRQPSDEINQEARAELWRLLLEAEYYQQSYEWKELGEAFDVAAEAAFLVSPGYPEEGSARAEVARAFWTASAESAER